MSVVEPVLEVSELSKEYFGIPALEHLSCSLYPGEIKGVLGENGAGKSTFMKCLSGIEVPSSGRVTLGGQVFKPKSAFEAMNEGVVLVHQELNLCEDLTVFENVWLGIDQKLFSLFAQEQERRAHTITTLRCLGYVGGIDFPVCQLTIGDRQLVEIAKALVRRPRVLILDEPTSSLGDKEALLVLSVIKDLARHGVAVMYISHKMSEIESLCSTVLVLRDGKKVFEGPSTTSREQLYEHIARRQQKLASSADVHCHKVRGEVDILLGSDSPTKVTLPRGAVVGVVGLSGAGKTSLLEELSGFWRTPRYFFPIDSIGARALVPDDRKHKGLVTSWSVRENLALSLKLPLFQKVNVPKEFTDAQEAIAQYQIKARGPDSITQYLSGGNQQKVLLAKSMRGEPSLLLLDEPTRGIDVGAKDHIYEMMKEYVSEEERLILFSTSELEEALRVAEVIIVLKNKSLSGVVVRDSENWNAQSIVRMM